MIPDLSAPPKSVPVTAVVTAYKRVDQIRVTLQIIRASLPPPDEIIVHVDADQTHVATVIRDEFPEIEVIYSKECIGPGGGRNKLIAAARNEYVASFDDDSYPIDRDFFARAISLFEKFPNASILSAAVFHQGHPIEPDAHTAEWVSDFSGGACLYQRTAFQQTGGYVPLPIAYGMEEADIALRLHAQGGKILRTSWLRVFHDTDLRRHAQPEVTAGSIANVALLTYLRYPRSLWFVGVGQCLNRICWLLKNGRSEGILTGILRIPFHLRSHQSYRRRIQSKFVKSYLALRRYPIPQRYDI